MRPADGRTALTDMVRGTAVAVVAALVLVLTAATSVPLPPDAPVDLPLALLRLDDRADVLDGAAERPVERALSDVAQDEDFLLLVVFVRTFGGVDPDTWAFDRLDTVLSGRRSALLAVAVDDRLDATAVSYRSEFPLDDFETAIRAPLHRGDREGAVLAGADAVHGGPATRSAGRSARP